MQSGAITPDKELEAWLREKADAPKADYTSKLDNTAKADSSDRAGDKEG